MRKLTRIRAACRQVLQLGLPTTYVRTRFRRFHGYWPNLEKPSTFSEKLAYRRLFERDGRYLICSNKLRVREYATRVLDTDLSPPLIGAFQDLRREHLDSLDGFVLKTTHGSGNNAIVKPGQPVDLDSLIERFNRLVNTPSPTAWRYNRFPAERWILVEQLLLDESGTVPNDYKYFGELTFMHRGGYCPIEPREWDARLGSMWHHPTETAPLP